jgi:MFS family permease
MRAIPKDEGYVRSYFDVPGSILIVTAIITGIFALERSTHIGFENFQIVSATIICIISATSFIIWERFCDVPLLNLKIFRSRKFSPVFAAYFLINLVGTGKWYLVPFYLALIMGFDSATSGMYMFIQAAITVIISVPIGRWSDRIGRRWFSVVSCLAMAISCVILIFIDPSMGLLPLISVAILSGILWGFSGPAAGRIVEHVQEGEEGTGAALIAVSGYLGATVGAAFFAALFSFINNSGNIPFSDLDPATFLQGFHGVMVIGLVMAIIAAVLSAAVKDKLSLDIAVAST